MTSHDVVGRVRKALGERRVGHSGTLDPDATGVLVVGVGNATRLLRFVDALGGSGTSVEALDTSKSYTADVVLGTETSSLDASGDVVAEFDMGSVVDGIATPEGRARLEVLIAENLTGTIMQTPPMVSAIRVDGRRLHELAREGVEVEREARPVTVHSFRVTDVRGPVVSIDVDCSSGTYVRSLGESLGRLLGGGAHIRNLRRTAVGAFTEADAVSLDDVSIERLRPLTDCVRALTRVDVDEDTARRIGLGQVLPDTVFSTSGRPPWAVVAASDGSLLAVYELFDGHRIGGQPVVGRFARPVVVIAQNP